MSHSHASVNLTEIADIRAYVAGGKAIFTLENPTSGNRFTYRVRASERPRFFFVDLLTGEDNRPDYSYIGTLAMPEGGAAIFRPSNRSPVPEKTLGMQALAWLASRIDNSATIRATLDQRVVFWTSGRCSRCGRLLTVPESIAIGMGPTCLELSLV